MSQDDSTAPETRAQLTQPDDAPDCSASVPLLVGLVLVARGRPVRLLRPRRRRRRPGRGADCVSEQVTLTTAPVMEDLVDEAVKDVNADEPCIDIQVTTGTVKDVVALAGRPRRRAPRDLDPRQPDLEGPADRGRLDRHADRRGARPDARRPDRRPRRQGARLVGRRPRRRQPRHGRPERRGCLRAGPAGALRRDEADRRDRRSPSSRRRSPSPRPTASAPWPAAPTETDLTTISASSTQLVPATEQAYLAARRSNDQLSLVAPKTGVPMLQYPLIDVNRGSKDILASGGDLSARVGRALTRWFTSSAGVEAIAAAELRGPDGAPLPNDIGLGDAKVLTDGAPADHRRHAAPVARAVGARPASSRSSTCPAR